MVFQSVRNLPEYHSVIAESLIAIINKLPVDEAQARKIIVFNTRQAYILYRMDTPEQRATLDSALLDAKKMRAEGIMKYLGPLDYDYILKQELDAMTLDKLPIDELEIKMFTYMTLAGIKPVQSSQQRAVAYQRFTSNMP